jgi:hypothetical protein
MQIAICERFNPHIHGYDENSSPGITEHFLIYTIIELNEFNDNSYKAELRQLQRYNKEIRLEIIQADELTPGQEQVCYLKTFWLRIVQRRWKKVFKLRKELLRKRSCIKALQERQRTGKWPIELRDYPAFKLQLCY